MTPCRNEGTKSQHASTASAAEGDNAGPSPTSRQQHRPTFSQGPRKCHQSRHPRPGLTTPGRCHNIPTKNAQSTTQHTNTRSLNSRAFQSRWQVPLHCWRLQHTCLHEHLSNLDQSSNHIMTILRCRNAVMGSPADAPANNEPHSRSILNRHNMTTNTIGTRSRSVPDTADPVSHLSGGCIIYTDSMNYSARNQKRSRYPRRNPTHAASDT